MVKKTMTAGQKAVAKVMARKLKKPEWIENYFIQATCYAMMFEWIYKIAVPQIVILITVDDEKTPQVFKLERSQYVNRVLEIFRQ